MNITQESNTQTSKRNEEFQNIVFHFNPYTDMWGACEREHLHDLFNNHESKNVIRSSKIETLILGISKYKSIKNFKRNVL
jgi:hypothetical protein